MAVSGTGANRRLQPARRFTTPARRARQRCGGSTYARRTSLHEAGSDADGLLEAARGAVCRDRAHALAVKGQPRLPRPDHRCERLAGLDPRAALDRYANRFGASLPSRMGGRGAPFDLPATNPWELRAHFNPPLLRSASVRESMVGCWILPGPQCDLTVEQAAGRLRRAAANPIRKAGEDPLACACWPKNCPNEPGSAPIG